MIDLVNIGNQLRTLEGRELVDFWLTTLDSIKEDVEEFQNWYKSLDTELQGKLCYFMRQWIDIWGPYRGVPKEECTLPCLECRTSKDQHYMTLDPDPEPGTRWKCPHCGARF